MQLHAFRPNVQAPPPPFGMVRTNPRPFQTEFTEPFIHSIPVRYQKGDEIFGQGEPANLIYRVLAGSARVYRLLSDGRRQIVDFHHQGDVFGLEAGPERMLGAEAITELVLERIGARALDALTADNAALRGMWALSLQDVQRTREHMLLLSRPGACERVAAFLMDLSDRLGAGDILELPMTRQDMADYLGLTIESVSRAFTHMQTKGWIDLLSARRLRLDRLALRRLCR